MKKLWILSILSVFFASASFAQGEITLQPATPAEFVGGMEAMLKYMNANVKYPEEAKNNHVEGTIFVQFVVEKDGKVTESKVVRGEDMHLILEAMRVVTEMPNWVPGKDENGKALRTYMTIPVKFSLSK